MGGKDGGEVNAQPAVDSYKQGAEEYAKTVAPAMRQAIATQGAAAADLLPFSDTALAATAEIRDMLGLAPMDPAKGIGTKLRAQSIAIAASPFKGQKAADELTTSLGNLANLYDQASREADPVKRAALRQQVAEESKLVQDRVTAAKQAPPPKAGKRGGRGFSSGATTSSILGMDLSGDRSLAPEAGESEEQYKTFLAQLEPTLSGAQEEFQAVYTDQPAQAKSSQEIIEKLRNTPGYKFREQQGTQAMERSQAARGTLQSGNALAEAQQFGQGLADQTYGQHMGLLSGLAGLNMGAVGQQAANQQQVAQTQMQAGILPGQARQSAFTQAGNAQMQAAQQTAQNRAKQQSGFMGALGGIGGALLAPMSGGATTVLGSMF